MIFKTLTYFPGVEAYHLLSLRKASIRLQVRNLGVIGLSS